MQSFGAWLLKWNFSNGLLFMDEQKKRFKHDIVQRDLFQR